MAYEQRASLNYVAGTLSTAAAISDITLSADIFASLPSDLTTTKYLPLVIHDPTANLFEIVWATAHTAASTSVTVARGRESTTARAWPAGSYVICSPTIRDALITSTLAGLPTDAHAGMRAMVTDKSYVTERTGAGAWGPSSGVAFADDIGPRRGGTFPTVGAGLVLRAAFVTGVTDSQGKVSVTYRQPFTTATVAVAICASSPSVPIYSVAAETASGFTAQVWQVSSLSPFTTVPFVAGYSASFNYIALGF